MRRIDLLSVLYHGQTVGHLTLSPRGNCLFEYSKEWLSEGFSLSPLKLPLRPDLFEAEYLPFDGLFGIFADSLPGGYGEYMLQKVLSARGIDYAALDPLQRLSIVGASGMGALTYLPAREPVVAPESLDLDHLQQEALETLAEKSDTGAGLLYAASGNSGGVRPKVLLRDAEGSWLVKLRHTYDRPDAGTIELLYNRAAEAAGIVVPRYKLFEGRYFGVQRFDLGPEGTRIHVATASGLLDEPINPPKMDYRTLLALTGYLTQDGGEVEQQFRRMVFNYAAENCDDHARNFSFLCFDGRWRLAPAYDMTHDNPLGTHATTVGYSSRPTDEDFIRAGEAVHISRGRCREIIREVRPAANDLLEELRRREARRGGPPHGPV